MSALYGFDLVMRRGSLRAALAALADLADTRDFKGCTVDFSEPPELWVPFDGECEHGPLDRVTVGSNGRAWFHASLWLPVDDAVRDYLNHVATPGSTERRTSGGREQAAIGLVSVFMLAGARWEILSIGAVTTWMSRLFERSAAVRSAMVRVLDEAGGCAALMVRDGDLADDLLLPGVTRVLPSLDDEDPVSIDAFAHAACERPVE